MCTPLCNHAGFLTRYFATTEFLKTESEASGEITFYDTVTGKPLFIAPRGRTWASFVAESKAHGWPVQRAKAQSWIRSRTLVVVGDVE